MMIDEYKALIQITKGVVCLFVALLIFIIASFLEGFNSNITDDFLIVNVKQVSNAFNWLYIYIIFSYVISGLTALFGLVYYIIPTSLDYISELFIARSINKKNKKKRH